MARDLTVSHPLLVDEGERRAEAILPTSESGRDQAEAAGGAGKLDWRQGVGVGLILVGLVAVMSAWIGVSGTTRTADQLSFITSGGLGGAVFIALGVVMLVSLEHRRDREAIAGIGERLGQLEEGLAGEFGHLYAVLGEGGPDGPRRHQAR